jgi:hypothetical protein
MMESSTVGTAARRLRRRAILDLVVSLVLLVAFFVLWLTAHVSGWIVLLGALVLVQAVAYAAFVHRVRLDVAEWRGIWLQITISVAAWAAAVAFVAAHLSVAFMFVWLLFAILWIGWMLRIYIGIRRRSGSA